MLVVTNFDFKLDWAINLWQQFEFASELESGLRDIADWRRKWIVNSNAGQTQLGLFDRSNKSDAIDVKKGCVCP